MCAGPALLCSPLGFVESDAIMGQRKTPVKTVHLADGRLLRFGTKRYVCYTYCNFSPRNLPLGA